MADSTALAEIVQLKSDYCHYIDHGRVDDWVELYTETGEMTGGFSHQDDHVGHTELRKRLQALLAEGRQFTRHLAFNPRIRVDGDTATGRWNFLAIVVTDDGTMKRAYGDYFDEYQRRNGDWKIHATEVDIRMVESVEDGFDLEFYGG